MYYPLVGDRVRVSGCRDEYIVARTDYATSVAIIVSTGDMSRLNRAPFRLLIAICEFRAEESPAAVLHSMRDTVRFAHLWVSHARVLIVEMQETIRATQATIRRSQATIAESDCVIARSRMLVQAPGQKRRETREKDWELRAEN